MRRRFYLISYPCLVALGAGSLHTSVAMAQSVDAAPAADSDSAADDDAPTVEEIIVTAQRREERLQDVPIAITALSGDSVAARGINDTESLQNAVAGLNFARIGSFATPYIRGVGTNVIAQGDENSVAIYVDGVYQLSPNSGMFSLNNIERVEVLKGPQGTLFGRNANGGVINVITRDPSESPALDVSVGVANYQTYEASLYGTTGLAPGVAADLSVYARDQADGWGVNLATGEDVYRGYEVTVRSKIRADLPGGPEIVLAGGYSKSRDDSLAFRLAPGELGSDGVTTFPGFYNANISMDAYNLREAWDAHLRVRHDFGWAEFTSITGYSDTNTTRPSDNDATPAVIQDVIAVDQYDRGVTQELQLSSAAGPLEWIGGLFFLDAKAGYRRPRGITIIGSSNGGLDFVRVFGDQKVTSYAAYAQLTYDLAPATQLTLGGRYTMDERSIRGNVVLPAPLGAQPEARQAANFNKFTYRVSLDHRFSDQVMVYVSHSTGFKGGLFNNTAAADPAVRPETLKAYEAGVKATLADRRLLLNGSIFHYDYKDIQANVYTGVSGGLIGLLNAAKARIRGFDADLTATPVAGLTLQASLSYLDPEYQSFPGAPFFVPDPAGGRVSIPGDAAGNQLIKTSKWQYNFGGQYEAPLGQGSVTFAANYAYRSEFYWEFANLYREGPQRMLSASVTWAPNDTLYVRAWGRNLLDDEWVNNALALTGGFLATPGAPRTYGITLGAKLR